MYLAAHTISTPWPEWPVEGKVFPEFFSGRSTGVVGDTGSPSLLLFNVTGIHLPLTVLYCFLNSITRFAGTIEATHAAIVGRSYELRL